MIFNAVKVTKIVDGDTIDVLIDLGFCIVIKQRLRLSNVNTPEMHDPDPIKREAAQRAKDYLTDVLLGKPVIIVTEKTTEKYGRYLAEVFLENSDKSLFSINDSLLDLGYAIEYQ